MQHDWKHVERPGESHTALDGKKKSGLYSGFQADPLFLICCNALQVLC